LPFFSQTNIPSNKNTHKTIISSVPRSCIYDLWESFNDIAEGFGLTIEEFQEIIKSALMEYVGVTEKILNIDTEIVFRLYDDDEVRLKSIISCSCGNY